MSFSFFLSQNYSSFPSQPIKIKITVHFSINHPLRWPKHQALKTINVALRKNASYFLLEINNTVVRQSPCIIAYTYYCNRTGIAGSPTETPYLAHSVRALSTISLRWMALGPLRTALQVITTFGLQSRILWARDSAEKPANTTWRVLTMCHLLANSTQIAWINRKERHLRLRTIPSAQHQCEHMPTLQLATPST